MLLPIKWNGKDIEYMECSVGRSGKTEIKCRDQERGCGLLPGDKALS